MGGDIFSVRAISPVLTTCTVCTVCAYGNLTVEHDTCVGNSMNFHPLLCPSCPGVNGTLLDLSKTQDCKTQQLLNISEDCTPGSYLSVSILTISGEYIVSVQYKSSSLSRSPFTVMVNPASPYALKSSLSPNQQYTATAGRALPFLVSSSDMYGNLVESAASDCSFRLDAFLLPMEINVGSSLSDSTPPVDGVFTLHFSFTVSGKYSVSIVVLPFNQPIRGSPFSILVKAGDLNASMSNLDGDGITLATAGITQQFTIVARDKFANIITDKIVNATAFIQSLLFSPLKNLSLPCNFSASSNGTLLGKYHATVSSTYILQVSFQAVNFMGAPSTVSVKAGVAYAGNVAVSGPGLNNAVVGVPSAFGLKVSDVFGNARSLGGDVFEIALLGGWTKLIDGESISSVKISASLLDLKNGSYIASYILTRSGSFTVNVDLITSGASKSVSGSPFSCLTVYPVDVSARNSLIYGVTNSTPAEDPKKILVLGKDIIGNPANPSANDYARFSSTISFNSTLNNKTHVSYILNGSFAVEFSGKS